MVRANSALIIALGDLLTLDLEPCSSSPISQSSTTIASVSLTCSLIAVSDPLAILWRVVLLHYPYTRIIIHASSSKDLFVHKLPN